ncbi:hypothetical protein JCM11251_006069 [Rhodosporidiobolus azoricus]
MSSINDTQKKKKPPACDRCKAKRVLCHPDPRGCPRCVEKGVECTTTPVVRRKPRRKRDPALTPAIDAPLLATQPEIPQANPSPNSSTSPLEALLSAAASPAAAADSLSYPPPAVRAALADSDSPAPALVPFFRPYIEVTPALAKLLFDSFAQTPQFCHPCLGTSIRDSLELKGWQVALLPLSSRALAYSIFAIASLVSYAPEIIGTEEPCPPSFAAIQAQGHDLRSYGRRRKAASKQLTMDALRCAKEADAMLDPTLENTATCVLLNALADMDNDERPVSRPFHAAFLSHVRSTAESALVDPLPLHAVRWGCYLAVNSLTDVAEGRFSLTRFDELLFVGGDAPDPAAYAQGLAATLQRPVDRSLWPDLTPSHARRRPVNEHGLLRNLERLHQLRTASKNFCAIMDRLLEPYQPLEVNLFPGGPARIDKINRAGALGAMRCFTIWTWTGCVLPFYRELQRRSRLNQENPDSSFSSPDPATRLGAERLEVYLKQARELCFFALEGIVEISPNAPISTITLNRRGTLPEWAEFLLEEIEAGTTPLDCCRPFADPLVVALQHYGYVVCSPRLDELISRLVLFLLIPSPRSHLAAPPSYLHDPSSHLKATIPALFGGNNELPIPPSKSSFPSTMSASLSSSSASLPPAPTTSSSGSSLPAATSDILDSHLPAVGGFTAQETAQGWADELRDRIMTAEELQGNDGHVVLNVEEAAGLVQTLQETVSSYLETPATRADILDLMQHITQATSIFPNPLSLLSSSSRRSSPPSKLSIANTLPADVIRLILLELRAMFLDETETENTLFQHRGGAYGWWATLRHLRSVSSGFKEVCDSLYRSQLHIVDSKELPLYARTLAKKARLGNNLNLLRIACYDFEYTFSRSSEDAGFAIPELIERAPNLRTFSLTADRPASYTSSSPGIFRRRQRFESLTGGISLPITIANTLTNLRTLVYGAPCALADVALFASDIPTLQHLDVLGEVEHSVVPAAGFKPCSRSLRRLWLPSTALSAAQLETLLVGPPHQPLDASSVPRVTSLAFTFDPEQYFQPAPPSEDAIVSEIAQLVGLFEGIGPQLTELHLSMPAADLPDATRIPGMNGVWPPGGVGQVLTVILPFGAGPQPGQAAGGGVGVGGGGGGGMFGNAAAGGAGQAGQGGAAQGGQAGGNAQGAPPAGGGGGFLGNLFGAIGGAAAAQGPAGGAGAARRTGVGQGPAPALNPPAGAAPPQGAPPAPAPPRFRAANPANPANALQQLPPPHPFFERLISSTTNLQHLELFGRRYTEDLIPALKHLPLLHLALSVPVDALRERVAEDLLEALEQGEWKKLKRLELSGRGGEWAPAERRKVKQAVEKRDGVQYKSTDMKG